MNKEQEEIKEKARSKRQRRAKAKGAPKTPDDKKASAADPNRFTLGMTLPLDNTKDVEEANVWLPSR